MITVVEFFVRWSNSLKFIIIPGKKIFFVEDAVKKWRNTKLKLQPEIMHTALL